VLLAVEAVLLRELLVERVPLLSVDVPVLLVSAEVAVVLPVSADDSAVEEESVPMDDALVVPVAAGLGWVITST
jgi:hypothetical protein